MYTIKDLYDLDHTLAKDYLLQFTYPWEALKGIKDMIIALGETLGDDKLNINIPRLNGEALTDKKREAPFYF